MVTTFTYRPSLVKIDARNFELSYVVTDPQTNRDDYNTLRRSVACSVMKKAPRGDANTALAVVRRTHKQTNTHKQTCRQGRLQYTAQLNAQCNKLCGRPPQYAPVQACKLTFDLLTLKVVSESRVTWATSVPILVFLGLSVLDLGPKYATDRQTSDAHHSLMHPGRGIIISEDNWNRMYLLILTA